MALTVEQELKTIAVRHRWALEELVYDQKMVEHNWHTSCRSLTGRQEEQIFQLKKQEAIELFGSVALMYRYLFCKYHGPENVLSFLRTFVRTQPGRRKTLWRED